MHRKPKRLMPKFEVKMTIGEKKIAHGKPLPTPTERPKFPTCEKIPAISDKDLLILRPMLEDFYKSMTKQKLTKTIRGEMLKKVTELKMDPSLNLYKFESAHLRDQIEALKRIVDACSIVHRNHSKTCDYHASVAIWKKVNKKPMTAEERLLADVFCDPKILAAEMKEEEQKMKEMLKQKKAKRSIKKGSAK